MKKQTKFVLILSIVVVMLLSLALVACDEKPGNGGGEDDTPFVDYVSQLKFDENSETKKMVVTVKNYVDGDTTHFNDPNNELTDTGVIKARYLAINTPESTGRIEEYGKKASRFTREKLENASQILIESDDGNWNLDSTSTRYLLWVWYKTSADAEWRNLNVEILQNGLALASNTNGNRYGTIAFSALQQARNKKINMYSGVKDPEVYTGDAIAVTLKELRTNLNIYSRENEKSYNNKKVSFDGVIVKDNGNRSIYVESLEKDELTGLHYGMTCYYGFDQNAWALRVLTVGNHVRIVGTVQYYENGNTYQIADMTYDVRNPDDPSSIKQLDDKKYTPAYQQVDVKKLNDGTTVPIEIETDDEVTVENVKYAELLMDTSVRLEGLTVTSVYTTQTGDSQGALTLTCKAQNGYTIVIRTNVLRNGTSIVTEDEYRGKTINVEGVVNYFKGKYQIGVFSYSSITIVK